MEYHFESNEFSFKFVSVNIKLHRKFNTAHSSSSQRVNFAIKIKFQSFQGFGQCGLPPKKPGCYLADISDCFNFSHLLQQALKHQNNSNSMLFDQFSNQPINYFQRFTKHQMLSRFCVVLNACQKITNSEYKAAKSAFQFAIFDLWSKMIGIKMSEGIFPKQMLKQNKVYGFYTLSQQQNNEMIENGKYACKITEHIKIKYNNDVKGLIQVLKDLKEQQIGEKWIIDLNCSWSPKQMQFFMNSVSENIRKNILYIEQPFSLQIEDYQEWVKIKEKSPIKIIADQSFTNSEDIQKVLKVAHGVNIKNQKTGGIFNTLKAAIKCKQNGLQVIFGSMVSTQLACSQSFQFHPIGQYFDIDGSLLVKYPSFAGGFQWGQKGQLYQIGNIGFDGNFHIFDEQNNEI